MAKLAQSATAALQTKLTLVSSHLNGFMGHRAKAFSERDSLERIRRRLMSLQKMPRGVGGCTISRGSLRSPSAAGATERTHFEAERIPPNPRKTLLVPPAILSPVPYWPIPGPHMAPPVLVG